jgi:hypothetical protein
MRGQCENVSKNAGDYSSDGTPLAREWENWF